MGKKTPCCHCEKCTAIFLKHINLVLPLEQKKKKALLVSNSGGQYARQRKPR